jgi:hypothetical protein
MSLRSWKCRGGGWDYAHEYLSGLVPQTFRLTNCFYAFMLFCFFSLQQMFTSLFTASFADILPGWDDPLYPKACPNRFGGI